MLVLQFPHASPGKATAADAHKHVSSSCDAVPRFLCASRANATVDNAHDAYISRIRCVCVSRLQHVSRGKATAADARDAHVFEDV